MKDSEFIELLNLYLDHEITPADAERLENEVQSNPSRRRVYQDYCRMQKACKLLAGDFQAEPVQASKKVVPFDVSTAKESRSARPAYWVGGLTAAAACVALIFVADRREAGDQTANMPAVAQVAPAPQAAAPAQLVATAAPAYNATIARPAQTGMSLRAQAQQDAITLASTVQNDPHFAWMNDMRLTPLEIPNPVEQLRLEVNPVPRQESRTYSSSQPLPDDVRWVSVRFQK